MERTSTRIVAKLASMASMASMFFMLVAVAGIFLASPVQAQAQEPAAAGATARRTLSLVVPFPPGAGADGVARMLAERLTTELGHRVLVDNKPGADANIAIQFVAQAKPDGSTLLLANPTVVYNHLITSLDFDPLTALDPVAKVTEYSLVLLMSGGRSPANLDEFVTWARSKPGGVSCGGGGGAPFIACQMLLQYGQLPVTLVPYKGNAPALQDLMGGHLDIMFDMSNSASAQLGNSKVMPLATTAESRSEAPFGSLPILRRTMPRFKLTSWLGLFAPAGMPPAEWRRLEQALEKTLSAPDFTARMAASGLGMRYENSAAFRRSLAEDRRHYEQVFKDIKMTR